MSIRDTVCTKSCKVGHHHRVCEGVALRPGRTVWGVCLRTRSEGEDRAVRGDGEEVTGNGRVF